MMVASELCLPPRRSLPPPREFSDRYKHFFRSGRKHFPDSARFRSWINVTRLHRLVWQHYSTLTHKESSSSSGVDKSLRKQEPRKLLEYKARGVSSMINTSIRATIHISQRNASTILYIERKNIVKLSRRKDQQTANYRKRIRDRRKVRNALDMPCIRDAPNNLRLIIQFSC